jgi:hypothetical protein
MLSDVRPKGCQYSVTMEIKNNTNRASINVNAIRGTVSCAPICHIEISVVVI